MEPETMMINNDEYVRKDSVENDVFEFTGEKTVASVAIGKNMIVRTRNEGLNVGTVELADETGIVLINCRRICITARRTKALVGMKESQKVVSVQIQRCHAHQKEKLLLKIMNALNALNSTKMNIINLSWS